MKNLFPVQIPPNRSQHLHRGCWNVRAGTKYCGDALISQPIEVFWWNNASRNYNDVIRILGFELSNQLWNGAPSIGIIIYM